MTRRRLARLAYNIIILGEEYTNMYSYGLERGDMLPLARRFSSEFTYIGPGEYWDIIDKISYARESADYLKNFIRAAFYPVRQKRGYDKSRMCREIGMRKEEYDEIGIKDADIEPHQSM